jgi:hypothetical protein
MFQRRFIIKIYYEGKHTPEVVFHVNAQYVNIQGHSIKIDGVTLEFSQNHYISVEMV